MTYARDIVINAVFYSHHIYNTVGTDLHTMKEDFRRNIELR